ncbi:hypothetical protein F5B19DRAFT_481054, partial [Rostrohypoxylon terebratum]
MSVSLETTAAVHFSRGYSEICFDTQADAKKLYQNFSSIFSYNEEYPTMLRFNTNPYREEPNDRLVRRHSRKEMLKTIFKASMACFGMHSRGGSTTEASIERTQWESVNDWREMVQRNLVYDVEKSSLAGPRVADFLHNCHRLPDPLVELPILTWRRPGLPACRTCRSTTMLPSALTAMLPIKMTPVELKEDVVCELSAEN